MLKSFKLLSIFVIRIGQRIPNGPEVGTTDHNLEARKLEDLETRWKLDGNNVETDEIVRDKDGKMPIHQVIWR